MTDIKRAIKILESNRKMFHFSCAEIDKDTALVMAVKALEKQIPKKPDIKGDGYNNDGNIIYDTWICPNCEEHYEVEYDNYDFCPKCGQAIDRTDI